MSSKEQQIRQWFLNQKEYAISYAPINVTDDYWEYSLDKPYYSRFFERYNYFREGLKEVYNDDLDAFLKDWNMALPKLISLYTKADDVTRGHNPQNPPITLPDFKDGLYVSIDIKNAALQSAIKEGAFTKEEYMNCFMGCKSADFFASFKALYCAANREHFLFGKFPSLIVDFPENNPYGLVARTPIGDNIILQPYCLDDFRDKMDGIMRLQSGYLYHISWVEKKTIDSPIGKISTLIFMNKDMEPQHFNPKIEDKKQLMAEFVPQLYKKLYNLPLEKFDLAFGVGDKMGFFPTPLFG